MLILIVCLIFGVLLFARSPRLEGTPASDTTARTTTTPVVRAYVDGKPVRAYIDLRLPERTGYEQMP